ncbi:hypothetical protein AMS68_000447 [Peltaster fructicola]|uniref:EF-hand domain-containing protein n=1 Tax=Peltaster fructicola TaxID=286661 RepID=A0A6H0XK86_9PEZI|nr:hypothetical protein AMS68_000447 [Peltaster fructicola]
MANNDATIDIPLEQVPTQSSGLRKPSLGYGQSHSQPYNEKRSTFRGRRHRADATQKPTIGYDGEEDTITTMGRIYTKILNFSIITRYFLYVLPLALMIAIPIIVGATAAPDAKLAGVRIVWFFTWIEIVWLSLWVSKLVAHFLPFIFQVLVGVVNSGIRKYALVIKSLEIPLSLVGWALASLSTFIPLMTKMQGEDSTPQDWQNVVQKVLAAFLVCSLIFLFEKLIVQLISINYHRKQFNSRIKESKRNVHLLGLLHEASIKLFPAYCNEFAEEDYNIADQLNLAKVQGKHHIRQISGIRTPLRLIQDVGRYGDKITSAFGNIAQEVTGKEVFNPNSSHSIVVSALERRRTSEALAKRIWMSFVVEGHESLALEDLVEVLGSGREQDAEEAFAALDQDGNGDISLDEMIMTVCEFSRERKSIANSMHDVDQAINVLDRLLMAVVLVAVVFVFVAFLNSSFTTTLATTGTALLSLSFVFAATCQEVLGSCIFLFVKHPYDIGDRVDIGADQYVVEHISLLFTVFRRVTGAGVGRLVQTPNIVLNTLFIENVTRSKVMAEQVHIFVSFDTSFEDIQILKTELHKFVTDKDNSRDFQPDFEVEVLGTTDMSKLELKVEVKHKSNWSNETLRAARRSKFMCALVSALRAVPIYAPGGGGEAQGSAANPNYSVSINDTEAKDNAKKAADGKAAARLIPPKKTNDAPGSGAGLTADENKIVDSLTSRNPGVDATRDSAWTSSRDDNSTLGRMSFDHGSLDDVRGLLRRESTKGKRKVGAMQTPGVPTIEEPTSLSSTYTPRGYGAPQYSSPSYQAGPNTMAPSPYQSAVPQPAYTEMSQMSPMHRDRSDSLTRKPIAPPPVPEDEEDPFGNMRPYSGV